MQPGQNSTSNPLSYTEWQSKIDVTKARISLYNQILSMQIEIVKIDANFIEQLADNYALLSYLNAEYPEYQI